MMSELRIILVILGCIFLIALYFWEVFFRSDKKKRNEFLDAIDELPDSPSISTDQFDDSPAYSRTALNTNTHISQQQNEDVFPSVSPSSISTESLNTEIVEETDIPALKKDIETLIDTENHMDISANDSPDTHEKISMPNIGSLDSEEYEEKNDIQAEEISNNQITSIDDALPEDQIVNEALTEPLPSESKQDPGLIMLYITSPAQTMFNGLSISKAADEVGMVYGHMNIFHHFGPGKLHSGQPLFSMANMFEPGSFDLGRMADLRTKGVVLFMYSPASIEATVVFELYLNTARRIAEYLNGELRMSDNNPLDNAGIEKLREHAESIANKQDI